MKQDDYMNRGQVMQTADRKIMHYICNAAVYLRESQEYLDDARAVEVSVFYKDRIDEWYDMSRLYKLLSRAEITAALVLVSDLEEMGFLDLGDWLNISHFLNWFGIPAEDRYD